MASKAATLGDPRRPQEIKKYASPAVDDNPTPLMMLCLMLAMGSMMLKAKVLAWAAIFVSMACIAHLRSDADYKQLVMAITFASMGLLNGYFMPGPPRPAAS